MEPLALDLPRFMQASDKDKADTLLNIIGVGDALTSLDREIKALYDRRTVIGQIGAQKRHATEELTEYPDAPSEPVSAIELIQQQQEILLRNADNQRQRDRLTEITHAKHRAMDKLTRLDEQLKNLQERRGQLVEEYNAACLQEEAATKTVAQLQDESTAELEQSIRNVEEINRQVSANLAKSKAQDEAERYAQEYAALTEQIKAKRTARMDLLNGADLPLTGLGVEDGSLTYNGKHWQDMSGSDQLRVATAIVRRLNPDCGFVLLDKLEQMDLATLAEFGSWLQTEGLQAIATRVSTGGECQIIIEDGKVKDAEEPPAPKAWTKGAF